MHRQVCLLVTDQPKYPNLDEPRDRGFANGRDQFASTHHQWANLAGLDGEQLA
jgi:hypothetical protein